MKDIVCKHCGMVNSHLSFKCFTKKNKAISTASTSREEDWKKYWQVRRTYFELHPVCEYPGCNSRKLTLHHKKGKIGALLYNIDFFCSLCETHHRWVEMHPEEAKAMGLSMDRL